LQEFAGHLERSGVPVPMLAAIISACTEFIGGLILLLGNGTRLAGLALFINMMVAVALVHRNAFALPSGMEYALTLAIVNLALVFTGPGRFTVLEMFGRRA
jgi:putative oxidoreductase